MKRRSLAGLIAATLGLALLALAVLVGGAVAKKGPKPHKKAASYEFLAGADSGDFALCSISPTACPDIARAANGDTVTIAGTGMLSVHPKSVSGTGTYSSTNTGVGSGTWTALKLLSFNSPGPTIHRTKMDSRSSGVPGQRRRSFRLV